MNSYDLLVACEKLGAHTVEVKESDALREKPMTGVANTTERNTVQCFLGGGYGEDDCEISPEEFSKRMVITIAIFS